MTCSWNWKAPSVGPPVPKDPCARQSANTGATAADSRTLNELLPSSTPPDSALASAAAPSQLPPERGTKTAQSPGAVRSWSPATVTT